KAKLASHLGALEQEKQAQRHTTEEWRQLLEKRTKDVHEGASNIGFTLGIPLGKKATLGFNLGADDKTYTEKEARNEIEQRFGLTSGYDEKSRTFQVHQISYYRLSESWAKFTWDAIETVLVATGQNVNWYRASP